MIVTSAELALHLGEDVTTLATCIRVIRRDGTVFAFTSATEDLVVDGVIYHAKGGFSPAASVETSQSLSVDSLEIEAILDDDGITEDDLRRGLFDGAGIDVFLVNWKNPSQGKLMLRRGTLGEVTLRRAQFAAEIRGSGKLPQGAGISTSTGGMLISTSGVMDFAFDQSVSPG